MVRDSREIERSLKEMGENMEVLFGLSHQAMMIKLKENKRSEPSADFYF